ncbi:MAG: carbohydrate binding family 9 domain-containing protein, partial [Acidobacteria bacterium]|nr:carbohydrate binding family 9 domain-containing protein [Acidobacteriota bacterium]
MTPIRRLAGGLSALILITGHAPASGAQEPPASQLAGAAESAPVIIDGPPPPVPPAVINRDAEGKATLRAVRVDDLTVDGVLDEPVYQQVPAAAGFIMQEPQEGPPATERTEVWVLFDEDNLYLVVRCWNSLPESEWIVRDMRRDSFNVTSGEYVGVLLDTFYDRRSGYNFGINPIGGRIDMQMTNERDFNMDWNPIWELRTGRFDGGWIIEAAFPFKSLRYRPGRDQVWGFQLMRNVQSKNERSFLNPVPAARGEAAIAQASLAAAIVGIEAPEDGLSFEIKPYAIADVSTDRSAVAPFANDVNGTAGIDLKYGITDNLVADFTVNTDFAQVEADEQQVNLTRFSLYFPEKREFFLENQGVFTFGGAAAGPFGGGGGETPVLFYSRRIGLNEVDGAAREVPIDAGARMTGRVGKFTVGVLNIQTGEEPTAQALPTNFSVLRVKRDLLRRSSFGALYVRRSISNRAPGSNETYGVDGAFGFFDDLNINTYWARTATAGFDDDVSYR